MKKIECIIRTELLRALTDACRKAGAGGMTISEVKGFGKETTRPEAYLVLPKTKVELYVTDSQVNEMVKAIIETCRTGELGDGKIAVLPMEDLVRIRTGEKLEKAIL